MNRRTPLAALASLVVVGCAPMTYQEQQAAARSDTSDDLCLVVLVRPQYKQAALDELARRGHQCDWPMAQARARTYLSSSDANNNALLSSGVQLLQMGSPRVLTSPGSHCTTRFIGHTATTSCY